MKASELKQKYTIEDELNLKDGRKLYRTHNGFRYWVESKKGIIEEVTEAYYNKSKQHRVKK